MGENWETLGNIGNIGDFEELRWTNGNFVWHCGRFPTLLYATLGRVMETSLKKKQKTKSETISDTNTKTRKLENKNFEKHWEKLSNIGDDWGSLGIVGDHRSHWEPWEHCEHCGTLWNIVYLFETHILCNINVHFGTFKNK